LKRRTVAGSDVVHEPLLAGMVEPEVVRLNVTTSLEGRMVTVVE